MKADWRDVTFSTCGGTKWQRLPASAKFLGSASNSGRGILPRRSGWKPLPLFRWIPTEHFKAAIET